MHETLRKYGFAAIVGIVLLGLGVAAAARLLFDAAATQGPQAGPGPGPGAPGGRPPEVEVVAATIEAQEFFDVVPAIGTARARESVVITSKVTDTIQRLRFDSGDRVKRGQVLVELANVEQIADLAEARASLEAQQREFQRFTELFERGFAPRARLEEAQAGFEQAQARVNALESRIADRTIRAPFDGVIGLREASPGTLARPGEPIATLDDLSLIKLDFDVAETQLSALQPGAEVVARTPAHPDEIFTGSVEDVDTRIDASSRTITARALLPNPEGKLKPGMLLTVEVRANPRTALSAPELAVLEEGATSYVFKIVDGENGPTVARTAVVTGERAGGRIEIKEGLRAGDRIVSIGVQRVRPGQPVAVQAETAAAPSAAPNPT